MKRCIMINIMVRILKFLILIFFPLMFGDIVINDFPYLLIEFPSTVIIATVRFIKSPQTVLVSFNPFSLVIEFYVRITYVSSICMIRIIYYTTLSLISTNFFTVLILINTLIIIFLLLLLGQACVFFCQFCYRGL